MYMSLTSNLQSSVYTCIELRYPGGALLYLSCYNHSQMCVYHVYEGLCMLREHYPCMSGLSCLGRIGCAPAVLIQWVDSYLGIPLGEYFWFTRANGVNGVKKGAREVSMSH